MFSNSPSQPGTLCDPLTEVLRSGARALLAQAVAVAVAGCLESHADKLTDDGRQRLVRHGHLPEREIMTGIGRSRCALRAFVTASAQARSALPSARRSCRLTRAARKASRS